MADTERKEAMLDYMIGDLARAIQDDRRAWSAKEARLKEAKEAHLPSARSVRLRRHRAAIAKALVALAFHLAPPTAAVPSRPDAATP
jgi:hypothetical protein